MIENQTWWLIAAAFAVVILAWILLGGGGRAPLPYFSRETLLSDGELAFYQVLRLSIPTGLGISMKVRLADVLDCSPAAKQQGFFAKVSQKHLDFVLYDLATTRIVAAVELDDRSHQQRRRQERDAFLEEAMAVAGVPLIRVPAMASYDAKSLRQLVATHTRSN